MKDSQKINEMCVAALMQGGAPEKVAREIMSGEYSSDYAASIRKDLLGDMRAAYKRLKQIEAAEAAMKRQNQTAGGIQ